MLLLFRTTFVVLGAEEEEDKRLPFLRARAVARERLRAAPAAAASASLS